MENERKGELIKKRQGYIDDANGKKNLTDSPHNLQNQTYKAPEKKVRLEVAEEVAVGVRRV